MGSHNLQSPRKWESFFYPVKKQYKAYLWISPQCKHICWIDENENEGEDLIPKAVIWNNTYFVLSFALNTKGKITALIYRPRDEV